MKTLQEENEQITVLMKLKMKSWILLEPQIVVCVIYSVHVIKISLQSGNQSWQPWL